MRRSIASRDQSAGPPSLPNCIWLFAVLGPLLGYAAAIFLLVLDQSDGVFDVLKAPFAVVLFAPFGLPIAWLIGLVPATFTGAAYWALRSKGNVGIGAAIVLCSLVASVICAGVAIALDGNSTSILDSTSWTAIVLLGVVATPLCAVMVERRIRNAKLKRWLQPFSKRGA